MPLALLPALIGGSATIGGGLLAKKSADSAAKKQQQLMSPLIQSQADASKWSLDQAKIDIPNARNSLQGPLDFWNKILKGDRNAAMSVAGPSADQLAGQTAAANRTQAEFAPRGGRRTLMLGESPMGVTTSLNQGLLALRPTAADETKSIGQILAQLGLGEAGNATAAGASAITGQLGASNLALQAAVQSGAVMKDLGSGIGSLLRLLMTKKNDEGGDSGGSGGFGNIGWSTSGGGGGIHEAGH